MPLVLAAPSVLPQKRLPVEPRPMKWTGFDGSEWDLVDLTQPMHLSTGVRGLHMPKVTAFETETALTHGSERTGYRIEPRSVYWPLWFRAQSEDQWLATYSGFFDSFHPEYPGIWTVGDGPSARRLRLVGEFLGDYSFTRDPFLSGLALIGVELTANQPLWEGEPITAVFTTDDGDDFIDEDGAPPFHFTPTTRNAEIENPGNEPAYLRWEITGGEDGAEEVRVGVGDAVIEVPFTVDDGSTLVIDTDPEKQFATLNGEDVTRDLGFQPFAPVPARGTSPLVVSLTGAGIVRASLTPLYWRAF